MHGDSTTPVVSHLYGISNPVAGIAAFIGVWRCLTNALDWRCELVFPRALLTFDQLNELLPSATTEPEDIEVLMEALSDEGITVVDEDRS